MKAEEIRHANELSQAHVTEVSKTADQQDVALRSLQISMLAEIAAQLAELNETQVRANRLSEAALRLEVLKAGSNSEDVELLNKAVNG